MCLLHDDDVGEGDIVQAPLLAPRQHGVAVKRRSCVPSDDVQMRQTPKKRRCAALVRWCGWGLVRRGGTGMGRAGGGARGRGCGRAAGRVARRARCGGAGVRQGVSVARQVRVCARVCMAVCGRVRVGDVGRGARESRRKRAAGRIAAGVGCVETAARHRIPAWPRADAEQAVCAAITVEAVCVRVCCVNDAPLARVAQTCAHGHDARQMSLRPAAVPARRGRPRAAS